MLEDMGIKYLGPIDGHNIRQLTQVMTMAKAMKGPVLIHVMTKGKGYEYAESNPGKFHGIGPFDCDSGELLFKMWHNIFTGLRTRNGEFSREQ